MHAPRPYKDTFEKVKQSTDLHTNTFCQRLIHAFVTSGKLEGHVAGLCREYGSRLKVMEDTLEIEMPDGVSWTSPSGGLFIWVMLPEGSNADCAHP